MSHQELIYRNEDIDISKKSILYEYTKTTFVVCEKCHWCATFFKASEPKEIGCLTCISKDLSRFPITSDESFTFGYDKKKGLEMDFRKRKKNH